MSIDGDEKHSKARFSTSKLVSAPSTAPSSGGNAHPLYKSVLQSQFLRDPRFGIEIALPSDIAE
jgi:hypothetical protein